MKFELVNTNIVNVDAEAIVLPANKLLKEGSGTSAAIFKAAGRKKLTKACQSIGTCNVGSAVPTLAFDLDAKYIIHAVVSKWIDGKSDEYELLSSAYLSALNVADVMGCSSIAFPLLASGNNGYDFRLAFQIAKETIESFEGTNLQKAILVLYGDFITQAIKNEGYDVICIPENIQKEKEKQERIIKAKQFANEGKEIAQDFLEEQIQKGLNYLKNEENREKILLTGINIVKIAVNIIKNKESKQKDTVSKNYKG